MNECLSQSFWDFVDELQIYTLSLGETDIQSSLPIHEIMSIGNTAAVNYIALRLSDDGFAQQTYKQF
jgi:hypothetical protein